MKKFKFIEVVSEIGAGTRGASLGIDAIKMASLNRNDEMFMGVETLKVQDENHLLFSAVTTPNAIRIDGITKIYERVSETVKQTLEDGTFPVILSGDHASAGGTIAGVKAAFPNQKVGVVWIDAHADLHSPYTTPSGNVHGMPLATALAENNIPCQINDLSDQESELWDQLKNVQGISPKITPDNLVFYSVRDTEDPENQLIDRLGIKNYSVKEVRQKSVATCVQETLTKLDDCDIIYISFDVDSMDSAITMGTGTPVANGLSVEEANDIIVGLMRSDKVGCFEVVEVNPLLDNKCNLMAENAFGILKQVVNELT